jgi:hypothetical protein
MTVIASTLISDIRSVIDAQYGPINPNLLPAESTGIDSARNQLAACIAEAGLYVVAHAQVNPGIPVSTAGSPTAQTGTTTAPGELS